MQEGNEEGRAGHAATASHQVTQVNVVQKSQPSTTDMLPACRQGLMATLGHRQDLSSSRYLYPRPQKSPMLSRGTGWGDRSCLRTRSRELLVWESRL